MDKKPINKFETEHSKIKKRPMWDKKVETALNAQDPNIVFKGRDGREYSTIEAALNAQDPNIVFKGRDGREYSTIEEASKAQNPNISKIINKQQLGFIGLDGREYSTLEAKKAADEAYLERQREIQRLEALKAEFIEIQNISKKNSKK